MENKNERETLPDLLRGVAIILVVLGHCIQEGSGEIYRIELLYFSDRIYQFIYSFHMPLFMMISGYLGWKSIKKSSEKSDRIALLKRRAASLMIPIFAWTALDYVRILIVNVLNGEPQPEALVFVYFYNALNNLWFLWAVWWCFLIVYVMHYFLRDRMIIYIFGFLMLFVIPDGLGLGAYKYMLPYYLFGYYMHDYMYNNGWSLDRRPKLWMTVVAGFVFVGLFLYYDEDSFIYLTGYKLVGKQVTKQLQIDIYRMLVGFAGSLFFVFLGQEVTAFVRKVNGTGKVKIQGRILRDLGRNSMGIYIVSGYLLIFLVQRFTFIDRPSYVWNVLEMLVVLVVSLFITVILGKIPILKKFVGK